MKSQIESDVEYQQVSSSTLELLKELRITFHEELSIFSQARDGWREVDLKQLPGDEVDDDDFGCPEEYLPVYSWKEEPLPFHISRWLNSFDQELPSHPQVLSIDENNAFLAVFTLNSLGEPEVVGGLIRPDGLKLASLLANTAVRQVEVAELQKLRSQYANRLSASFEELCFLRRLSKHIGYCLGNRSLSDVTQVVLPELRELVRVEALCLVQAVPSEHADEYLFGDFLSVAGRLPREVIPWEEILECSARKGQETIVRNFHNKMYRGKVGENGAVRSYVLAPIRKENKLFGWLLAVNKLRDIDQDDVTLETVEDELSSMEGSLLEAAARMLGSHASNHAIFQSLEALVVDIIQTLVGVVEARDAYTCGHSFRVAQVARILAQQLKLPANECEDIYTAGLLHDIGKIGVRDELLNKPGKLTDEEFEEIKQHPVIGFKLLEKIQPLKNLMPGVLYHHEAIDGSGYPCGLQGEEIPFMARILAVADALDAMTSHRPYRNGMSFDKATSILTNGAGTQWDHAVVAAFTTAQDKIGPLCNSWPKD